MSTLSRRFGKLLLSLGCSLLWACNDADTSNYPFQIVAQSLLAESGRLDIGPKVVNLTAGQKVNMDPVHLPVDDCHSTSTGPSCHNYWSGSVKFITDKGEYIIEHCQFDSRRQGSIDIFRDTYSKKLRLECRSGY